MIEDEVLEIIGDGRDSGQGWNGLVDQFRNGRNVVEILALLRSSRREVVSLGAWMLEELPFEHYSLLADALSRLRELTDHPDAMVRFHALGALFPALDREEVSTKLLLRRMREDPNEGVRRCSEAATARLCL